MPNTLFELPNNYIYISHLGEDGKYFILPNYPDQISDSMSSTFEEVNALSRSAPVFVYYQSGPRKVQISLQLHRDLMDDINLNLSNVELKAGEDYVDTLLNALQAIALPKYNLDNKLVEPPMVHVRISDEVFIKGIVSGPVAVVYKKPILVNGKYSQVDINFTVNETDPYDATTVEKNGGFRGITKAMKNGFHLEMNNSNDNYDVIPN